MSRFLSPFALSPIGGACRAAVISLLLSSTAWSAQSATESIPVIQGERLSAWLLRQPDSEAFYSTGLRWDVPEEKPAQENLKRELLHQLGALRNDNTPEGQSLLRWLQNRPVTGRAAISNPDSRWLEVNPAQDPILQNGQRVELPLRPQTASVLLDDGALCQVPYRAGVLALDYLRSCATDADQRDTVWIVQPDGKTSRYGIGAWNSQTQEPPAPGAWIWAPSRNSGIPASFSDKLVAFIATQGVAADGDGRPVGAPPETERVISNARSRDLPLTASDWGEIGLLQTPTARMAQAGAVRFTYSHTQPYTRATVMFQPLDWLEGGFRYTQVSNQLYDPTLTISNQSYKDKSVDAKVRLWEETRWIPQLSIGARDLGGTGLFSGEYVVANKRTGDLDWSLGLGWGYVGARGNLKNPLSFVSDRFTNRPNSTTGTGTTGSSNNKSYFRGPTSIFGGVQWQTPIQPLVMKFEYDGNDYKNEPFSNPINARYPINIGAVYRYSKSVDLSAGIERGNRALISVTFHGGLDQLAASKLLDPKAPDVSDRMPSGDPQWGVTAKDIENLTGWNVEAIARRNDTLIVRVSATYAAYKSSRLDKMTAVLHRDASASIKRFDIDFTERGVDLGGKSIERRDWVAIQNQLLSPRQLEDHNIAFTRGPLAERNNSAANASSLWTSSDGRLRGGIAPSFTQSLGGPDTFLLYQIGVQGNAEFRVTDKTWLSGSANLRVLDNYDKFKYTAPSDLPRVRTFAREFATASRTPITNLQLTHAEQITDNNFAMVYAGLLESMYGGVGGEYMYRRRASAWAFGIDANRVRQRGFDQRFSFRDYEVNTGHASVYWNTGWNDVSVRISAGQYLAGDRGATVDLSRRFSNGVILGAYATKTNVSAAQFGEGSFDKGIYVTFPFDAIFPRSTNSAGTILWQPLVRDGGARLARAQSLYGLTSARDSAAFALKPASP